MMPITIRQATPADVATIVDFNQRLAEETESKTLDHAILEAGVRAALADPTRSLYFLAVRESALASLRPARVPALVPRSGIPEQSVSTLRSEVVGQLMLTFEWSDWRNGWIWWIQSVYVRPENRREGIFRSLFLHIEQQAQRVNGELASAAADRVVGIRLYVERDNGRAQEVYRAMGMHPPGYLVFEKMFKP